MKHKKAKNSVANDRPRVVDTSVMTASAAVPAKTTELELPGGKSIGRETPPCIVIAIIAVTVTAAAGRSYKLEPVYHHHPASCV